MSGSGEHRLCVLVLAGARAGGDPLCQAEGVASKAVIEIGGQPMLARVLGALAGSRAAGLAPGVIGLEDAALAEAAGGHPCTARRAGGQGPAASLLAALENGADLPALVTTCDHALLTPAMIDSFLEGAYASGADLCVGFASRATIEAAYPRTRRTYLRFRGADLSGCNLFYLAGPRALDVLRFWRAAEQDRKRPWRILWRFGPLTALRILLFRPTPEVTFALLSRRVGADVRPVILPYAEAAIDVDTPGDLELVRGIVAERAA
ncbi:nucleotidyltransferase family protein [Maritimibacter sp. 55A14]|uniref:nucleotidyltransferase family protein n=1 Tax=Maritimibacter sp. 55A14 TaxID=2174844 RepID=UPI001304B80C|nr:nucleotidyltransferase family protein [Maritimibacter sp. 55A14]